MRRGIVLFITLAILLMLSTIVMLFLKEGGQIKESVRENVATVQTNLLLNDMSSFLRSQNFTQEDIFYGSDIPVALDLGTIRGSISLTSSQRRININNFLKAVMKEEQALLTLLEWLDRQKIKNPPFIVSLLLDSYDADSYERMNGSEIVLQKPWFQDGYIANERALEAILSRYSELSGDYNISIERWIRVFGFEGDNIDLNYANSDQLFLLFPELPRIAIESLAKHDTLYKSAADTPIDPESKIKLTKSRFGIVPTFKTSKIEVDIEFSTAQECSGKMSFLMELKKKRIESLSLSPMKCP